MTHLNDVRIYTKFKQDPTPILKESILSKLKSVKGGGFLAESWFSFCCPPDSHRTSRVYFLKKIRMNPHGIRPIVSSCGSITENISTFIDHWLQPYVKELPSYMQDSNLFINTIESNKFPVNCILVSIDISSLYTNTRHKHGIESIKHFLHNKNQSYKHPEQPTPQIITELTSIVLKNNAFEFNKGYYLQKQGTAIGTRIAPAYANLFMGYLEKRMTNKHIHIWKRFIDDIFLISKVTQNELELYMKTINSLHKPLKFTYESSKEELTLLDVTLYKWERFKQVYLHAGSYHPTATKKATIKGETKRYLRTNSNKHNFNQMKYTSSTNLERI